MKNNIVNSIKRTFPVLLMTTLGLMACTDDFESTNTNPDGIASDRIPVESRFKQPMQSIYVNYQNMDWEFQIGQNLNADLYSGYMAPPSGWNKHNSQYAMVDGWNSKAFNMGYAYVMKPVSLILSSTTLPDYIALAKIIRVSAMQRITDIYGPIPYSQTMIGGKKIAYDSQKDVYYKFFEELTESVNALSTFVDKNGDNPSTNRITTFDQMCQGSYIQWIRYANSLRLRMAMHIVKVDPTKAKQEAEAAVAQKYGVLTSADKNVQVVEGSLTNPLYTLFFDYNDCRIGASFTSILDGLKDPRLPKLVKPVGWAMSDSKPKDILTAGLVPTNSIGKYVGIRLGLNIKDKENYFAYSAINYPFDAKTGKGDKSSATCPLPIMKVAEVYFLRAEGALRGWNMNGTADQLYADGIRVSCKDAKVDAADIEAYIIDDINKPANYVDPFDAKNNINALSQITVKFVGDNETKLEKIITQKWISMFPEVKKHGQNSVVQVIQESSCGK